MLPAVAFYDSFHEQGYYASTAPRKLLKWISPGSVRHFVQWIALPTRADNLAQDARTSRDSHLDHDYA